MAAGRHREFNKDHALEKAMLVFWENGYPGTSLTDLTTAMAINKPSLYSAFGNKETLFNQALELYLSKHAMPHSAHLTTSDTSLIERVNNYLFSIANMLTDDALPTGCFVCMSTAEVAGSRLPDSSTQEVKKVNQQTLMFFTDFFEQEIKRGNLNDDIGSAVMANYILTILFGLAISARNGSDIDSLKAVITLSTRPLFI